MGRIPALVLKLRGSTSVDSYCTRLEVLESSHPKKELCDARTAPDPALCKLRPYGVLCHNTTPGAILQEML